MRVIVCDNYEKMSYEAARIFASQIIIKPNSVLGLATGSTPIGLYNCLAKMYENGELDFSEVTTFNLDEYYPIAHENDQSYHYFMNENFFSKVNVPEDNIHIPDGSTDNPALECKNYEKEIDRYRGIDLQILGIGQNGHIGFNEPAEILEPNTHVTDLTQNTIEANSRFFESIDLVPTKAITMGIGSIMKSKKILLLASGSGKKEIVKKLLSSGIDTNIPATMLKAHPDVTLICDREAYED
ncbi:MAG: glucosamine-6-phosphate deaminase [Clostridia bacterium]|nr:glucosamine-6-phosphate deaminase [Clostridia bacterium]